MCQINSVPMKYAIGYLDVLTPPVFDDQPTPASSPPDSSSSPSSPSEPPTPPVQQAQSQVTVSEGSNATLSCQAQGHPAPTIAWRREDGQPIQLDGQLLGEPPNGPAARLEAPALNFARVHRINSGAYLCIASNGVQPSASKRLVLDVQFAPVVTLPQTEVAASLGQPEARLECLVELNPSGSFHWIKLASSEQQNNNRVGLQQQEADDLWLVEHDELMPSDKYEIVMKQVSSERAQMVLNVRQIERQDFAHYKCIGRNSLGLQSNSIRLYESSSFSLNNMFRGGSNELAAGPEVAPTTGTARGHQATSTAGGSESAAAKQVVNGPRAHTRSSWTQRSSGSTARQQGAEQVANPSSASAGSLRSKPSVEWLLLLAASITVSILIDSGQLPPSAKPEGAPGRPH